MFVFESRVSSIKTEYKHWHFDRSRPKCLIEPENVRHHALDNTEKTVLSESPLKWTFRPEIQEKSGRI